MCKVWNIPTSELSSFDESDFSAGLCCSEINDRLLPELIIYREVVWDRLINEKKLKSIFVNLTLYHSSFAVVFPLKNFECYRYKMNSHLFCLTQSWFMNVTACIWLNNKQIVNLFCIFCVFAMCLHSIVILAAFKLIH